MKRVRILAIAMVFMAMLLPVSGQTTHGHIKYLTNANGAFFRFGGRNDQRALGLRGSIEVGTAPNAKNVGKLIVDRVGLSANSGDMQDAFGRLVGPSRICQSYRTQFHFRQHSGYIGFC
jgi:hypothetical protein